MTTIDMALNLRCTKGFANGKAIHRRGPDRQCNLEERSNLFFKGKEPPTGTI